MFVCLDSKFESIVLIRVLKRCRFHDLICFSFYSDEGDGDWVPLFTLHTRS